ncbi:Hypothetical predicted protein [Mytilus galloprovincialis]|uniref:Plastocyanin-like domain-containing protein n=1 Tax=Mytilus galloprovincialis TaxID=29158 RepID=A0A8B6GMN9_MYTGA|nr:Hypothetical predicted protein [Mytilus galloprovincialis]
MIGTIDVKCQNPNDTWWDILKTQGVAFKNDTCRRNDKTCECYLTIEHRLTMMDEKEMIFLVPSGGRFRSFNDLNKEYSQEEEEEFIAADGYGSRHESIRIVASDGFEIEPIEVDSLIIHLGERIDFILKTDQVSGNNLLVAETLEVEPASLNQYHAAEAIIYYTDTTVNLNPPKGLPNSCSQGKQCKIFNCPYLYYPPDQNRTCLTWNDAKTIDPNSNIEEVKGVAIELFYNFAFLGENGNTPWSVNGHQFLPPTVAAYAEWDKVEQNCGECSESSICECTYYDTIDKGNTDQVYQFVLTNIGNGAGWSHPIHLHGHSFYVMKMGFASYNSSTGKLIPDRGNKTLYATMENISVTMHNGKIRHGQMEIIQR